MSSVTQLQRDSSLTLLHSERPKFYTILAFLSAKGLNVQKYSINLTICLIV